jgi:hypothetical protein
MLEHLTADYQQMRPVGFCILPKPTVKDKTKWALPKL